MKSIEVTKGKHYFRFRYAEGDESAVLDALVVFVHRTDLPFDWFDAAVLSARLGRKMAKQLNSLLPPNPKTKPPTSIVLDELNHDPKGPE